MLWWQSCVVCVISCFETGPRTRQWWTWTRSCIVRIVNRYTFGCLKHRHISIDDELSSSIDVGSPESILPHRERFSWARSPSRKNETLSRNVSCTEVSTQITMYYDHWYIPLLGIPLFVAVWFCVCGMNGSESSRSPWWSGTPSHCKIEVKIFHWSDGGILLKISAVDGAKHCVIHNPGHWRVKCAASLDL